MWICYADDAWFNWRLDKAIKKGWYRIYLTGTLNGTGLPKIYYDYGNGYNELLTSTLYPQKNHKKIYTSIVEITSNVSSIRLNPIKGKGRCDLDSLCFVKLNYFQIAYQFYRKAFDIIKTDFKNAPRRLFYASMSVILGQRIKVFSASDEGNSFISPYDQWISNHDYNSEKSRDIIKNQIMTLVVKPKISVLMSVCNSDPSLLNQSILSVVNQIYENWELCVCDDSTPGHHTHEILQSWVNKDNRIKLVRNKHHNGTSKSLNAAFAIAKSNWITRLEYGDILREHSLSRIAQYINSNPNAQLIYSDEDEIDAEGNRHTPHFKPKYSTHLMRAMNYLSHLTVHRHENIRLINGWRPKYDGIEDFDLNIRVIENIPSQDILHIDEILYHSRSIDRPDSDNKKQHDKMKSLIRDHHNRLKNQIIDVDTIDDLPVLKTTYLIPPSAPLVSIIIPTKDKVNILKVCINAILLKTDYLNFEIIIVDNNSKKLSTQKYIKQLTRIHRNIKILKYAKPFNYSAINNFAVKHAKGKYICLLNNDTKVINANWLGEMVSLAALDGSGCIGAKLYYGNDHIQHAGVILGIGGVAGHSHKHFSRDSAGYFSRLKVVQNVSAVTAACLLVSKSIYEEVGGLDDVNLTVNFNDVDFCLRVQEAGYKNIWTPFAELYHYESLSRGQNRVGKHLERLQSEAAYMMKRWPSILYDDPYYSKNLTNTYEDFSIRK